MNPCSCWRAVARSCGGSLAGQGGHGVGPSVGLGGEQADHQREAHIITPAHRVQERLVGRDDEVQAVQRVADDGLRVRAVGDGEFVAAGARLMSWRGSAVTAPPRSPIRSARRRAAARACSAYKWRMWVLMVLCETRSSLAICGADKLVGR
jgi:hypothetical protein